MTNKVYVANGGSSNVTVIDGSNNTTATVAAGTGPTSVAVNPVTNKIYVANKGSNNVTVIDGSNNTTTTVNAGTAPNAVAINPATNKIYVANSGSSNVTVIDGSNNTTATVSAGTSPNAVAVNPVTNKIYVANKGSSNVTVIDGSNNTTTMVNAGTAPTVVAVNPITNKIYVANLGNNNVTVIDGTSNVPTTINAGFNPTALAINPVTNQIYVANISTGRVTVIDGVSNATTSLTVGGLPTALAVDPITNRIYVANQSGNSVSVIDAGNGNAITTVSVGTMPVAVAVDPVTNKIYSVNNGSNNVTVIDGASNAVAVDNVGFGPPGFLAVNFVTNKIYAALGQGILVTNGADNTTSMLNVQASGALAVNSITNQIYVGRLPNGMNVIDAASNTVTPLATGATPSALAINPVTNKIYGADFNGNRVMVIDAANGNSITTVPVGTNPFAIAANPVSNKIYVANQGSSNVTIIDGATNSVIGTVASGVQLSTSQVMAVNPVSNKIYVTTPGNNLTVTVIDGVTNATSTIMSPPGYFAVAIDVNPLTNKIYVANIPTNGSPGLGNVSVIDANNNNSTTTLTVETNPTSIAVNSVTNKIYALNNTTGTVSVIDGATNSITTVSMADVNLYPNGIHPDVMVINPVTNKIYARESLIDQNFHTTYGIALLTEQQVQPIPLTTAIAPLPANMFSFTTSSAYSPIVPAVQNVYFQFDTWQGPWLKASGSAPNFIGSAPALLPGIHIVYAYAADAQFGDSTQTGAAGTGQSSPIPGAIAAYVFLVVPVASSTSLPSSSANPAVFGQPISFTATVTSPSGTPSGVVTFTDGSTTLGTATLDAFGQATFSTSMLALGSHMIRAAFNGNGNFTSSTSTVLTQTVNQASAIPTLTAVSNPSTFGQSVILTATVNPQFTGTPTGAVTFLDGFNVLGSPATLNGAAQASFTTSSLALGVHNITAVYSGDANFVPGSSVVFNQVVMTAGTASTTTLTVNGGIAATIYFGVVAGMQQQANFVINVTGSNDGDSVVLLDQNQQLGPVLSLAAGHASYSTQLRVGQHAIQAVYLGNGTSAGSASAVTVNRSPRPKPR